MTTPIDPTTDPRVLAAAAAIPHGVVFATISGAHLYGFASPDSDVDLLVEFKPKQGPSLWGLSEMQEALSPLFGGRSVHIAGPGILDNPYRRQTIVRDLKLLYGR